MADEVVKLAGWGQMGRRSCRIFRPRSHADLATLAATEPSLIARGLGRAYGDGAVNPQATILTEHHDRLLEFDGENAVLTAQAGTKLSDIIAAMVPRGFFPPVVPGTGQVSLGGMVAADVHGKNHHGAGSFSRHVSGLDLILSDGRQLHCSPSNNPDLFSSAFGGMGLTGMMTRVQFRLMPIRTSMIRQGIERTANLEETLSALASDDWTYQVAWLDGLAHGPGLGRAVILSGDHAEPDQLPPDRKGQPLAMTPSVAWSVPAGLPSLLCRPVASAFNAVYYHTHRPGLGMVDLQSFFHPLDRLQHWNRLYGRRGLVQYQCVLPLAASSEGLRLILGRAQRESPFLCVLKRFGALAGMGPLSFPMEGYSLAMDFAATPAVLAALAEMDKIVTDHEGRLYLAKDARARDLSLVAGSKELARFRALRQIWDPRRAFSSVLSERLGL